MITCKNCNHTYEGKFCNHCGQAADTEPLDLKFIWDDIRHGLFHYKKGFLFTIKELYTRPGYSIREFIDGKRVKHFKPLSMIIVLAAADGLLYHTFAITMPGVHEGAGVEQVNKINDWSFEGEHYAWINLLLLPIFTLITYLLFRKQKRNYVELLVLNTYMIAQRLVFHIISFPLLAIYNGKPGLRIIFAGIMIVDFILMYWTYSQFFNVMGKLKLFFLSGFSTLINLVIMLSILAGCVLYLSHVQ